MKIHPKEPERLHLARLPTPVLQADRLANHVGIEQLFFKRDDLTGLATSGNKVRKLEYVVAQALDADADALVTVGGVQSNHCRATAAVAAQLGLHCRLLLRSDDPAPPTDGNLLLDDLFGAEMSFHPVSEFNGQRDAIVSAAMQELRDAGRKPFFVELGASIPFGNWGFIRCIHELVEQLGKEAHIDIYCATGSGGTQAGLILGKALFDCQSWNVYGVPVCDDVAYFQKTIRQLERDTNEQFGLNIDESLTPINLIDGFKGAGYGIPTAEAIELIRACASRRIAAGPCLHIQGAGRYAGLAWRK